MRQPLLCADDEIAGLNEPPDETSQSFLLQGSLKMGERNIAAENEVEEALWRL